MAELDGVNIAIGVTGSIAAVKVVELVHELRRRGATVRGVMTDAATDIIHPWALEFGTGTDVVTELTGAVEHVELCGDEGWADVFVIAPSTANTIGKIAAAVDDTPVTTCATTALGAGLPVVIAPAMHEPMYDHPGVLSAIDRLESWGVTFVAPRSEEGKAKIADEETIALTTAREVDPQPLTGEHVVVTGGPTAEPIDPVRVLTNRASGRTGKAIAQACYVRGATVTLVHAGGEVSYADVQQVSTAAEMRDAVLDVCSDADTFISAAAVGDFTIDPRDEKLSSEEAVTLELEPGPKIVDAVRDSYPEMTMVAFKLETTLDASVSAGRSLQDRINAAFVIANTTTAMGSDTTQAMIVDGEDTSAIDGTKTELGFTIADRLATA